MHTNTPSKKIDLDIAGNKQLKLVVIDAGNDNAWDHGNWTAEKFTVD
ncbi:hypothetical protein CFK37_17735 [Virgibacillus phasianinus]|uniref:Glycosyl hydrolase family 98 putative carbohydrate-binding module domain-containing protein n=1 Tax=Virgibacillus phasianinus TaxID=2017483 RepID=A0A220U6W4_9BACI|nr:NPCBM/NEW2 domain-containing protein [Virgibacillus phasianinus]ASK63869.1 hypothetical protein CFK37_17735 [Virgibacillus phasianinus]